MRKLHLFFPSGTLIYLKLLLRYSLAAGVFQVLIILFSYYFLPPSYRLILISGSMFVSDIIVTVSVVKKLEKLYVWDILHFVEGGYYYPPSSGQFFLNGVFIGLLQAPLFLLLMYFKDTLSTDTVAVTLFLSCGLGMSASVVVSMFSNAFGLKLKVIDTSYPSNQENILATPAKVDTALIQNDSIWEKRLRRLMYVSYMTNSNKHGFYSATNYLVFYFLVFLVFYFMGIMDTIDFGLIPEYRLEILSGLILPMFFYLPAVYILLTRNKEQILLMLAKARKEMFTPTSTHISKRAKIIMIIIFMLITLPMLYFSWMELLYGWPSYKYEYYLNSPVRTSIVFICVSLLLSAILQQVFLYILFKIKLRRLK